MSVDRKLIAKMLRGLVPYVSGLGHSDVLIDGQLYPIGEIVAMSFAIEAADRLSTPALSADELAALEQAIAGMDDDKSREYRGGFGGMNFEALSSNWTIIRAALRRLGGGK